MGPLEVDSPVKLLNNLSTMWSGNVSTGSGAEKLSVMVTRFRGFCEERYKKLLFESKYAKIDKGIQVSVFSRK